MPTFPHYADGYEFKTKCYVHRKTVFHLITTKFTWKIQTNTLEFRENNEIHLKYSRLIDCFMYLMFARGCGAVSGGFGGEDGGSQWWL